jgi:hypothetical protein
MLADPQLGVFTDQLPQSVPVAPVESLGIQQMDLGRFRRSRPFNTGGWRGQLRAPALQSRFDPADGRPNECCGFFEGVIENVLQ